MARTNRRQDYQNAMDGLKSEGLVSIFLGKDFTRIYFTFQCPTESNGLDHPVLENPGDYIELSMEETMDIAKKYGLRQDRVMGNKHKKGGRMVLAFKLEDQV